jgi:hypothetical protein
MAKKTIFQEWRRGIIMCCMAMLLSGPGLIADEFHNPIGPLAARTEPISANVAIGFEFDLHEFTTITAVGGMFSWLEGTAFFAIVNRSSLATTPPTNTTMAIPFEIDQALAFLTVQGAKKPDSPAKTLSFPLDVQLPPGSYALVFGSGLYGTAGYVSTPIYQPGTVVGSLKWLRWTGWASIDQGAVYDLFISGTKDIHYPTGAPILDGASALGAKQFLGAKFTFNGPVKVSSVAAELSTASGTFFAAIVALDSRTLLPAGDTKNGVPFNPGEVLAYKTFSASGSTNQTVGIPIPIELPPGSYGLVLGTGLFGTQGNAAMPSYTAVSGSRSFFWSDSPWRWQDASTPGYPGTAWNFSITTAGAIAPATLKLSMLSGIAELTIRGSVNYNYRIEYTDSLGDPIWVPLTSFNLSQSTFSYYDTAALSADRRFYRVVGMP